MKVEYSGIFWNHLESSGNSSAGVVTPPSWQDSTSVSPPEFTETWLKQNNMWLSLLTLLLQINLSYAVINISAGLRQNVTLPCKVPNDNKTITAVKWIRPGLGEYYVVFYRDGHLDAEYQHPSYKNRVDLQDKDMKDGNVSLDLMNVTMEDRGTYECQVYQRETNRNKRSIAKPETISIINLDVQSSADTLIPPSAGDKDKIIGGSVGAGLFVIAVMASVGFIIYRRCLKKSDPPPPPPDEEAGDIQLNLLNRR